MTDIGPQRAQPASPARLKAQQRQRQKQSQEDARKPPRQGNYCMHCGYMIADGSQFCTHCWRPQE